MVFAALSRQPEYAVTSEQLNLRSAPDPTAEVLAKLDFGSSGILALGDFKDHEDERWIKVKVGANVGWVNDRYVKPATPANFVIDDKPGFELDGDSFRSPNAGSHQECMKACLIDDRCKAMEFNRGSKACNLFKTIPEAVRNKDVDAGIKRASAP